MKVFRTVSGIVVENDGAASRLPAGFDWDALFADRDPAALVRSQLAQAERLVSLPALQAPVKSQEVWAAGVTYLRSRVARVAESKDAGGGTFYDKVYEAERPELFFKATPHRVAAPGAAVHIRRDSKWNVPEPELTLAINAHGRIFGFTIGNDMSSRDIEGENPLYLPQAKVYDRSAALGPGVLLSDEALPPATEIELEISRDGKVAFTGGTSLSQIKRSFSQLAEFLYRDNAFPVGCFLMTGTGIVPPDSFTLQPGDEIAITIAPIGRLVNTVSYKA